MIAPSAGRPRIRGARARAAQSGDQMPIFANAAAFDAPASRMLALGTDFSPGRALVDGQGRVVAHARTGGMMSPARFALAPGTTIYRFGGQRSPREIGKGAWWLEKREFEQVINFANAHGIFVGLAMRLLCLVPPEWSDASVLIRARVAQPLLAWRGMANTVVTPAGEGGGVVRMPHQNELSARRVHQLYIPGLKERGAVDPLISLEHVFRLDPGDSARGFLYL